jgi:hypothetical protein
MCGSTDPNIIRRAKIARILNDKPLLRARFERARTYWSLGTVFTIETKRVTAVLTKLAQGHALYELHEPCSRPPTEVTFTPLMTMDDSLRRNFESPISTSATAWPEVGSRALQRLILIDNEACKGWLDVQRDRYRYQASVANGIDVRIVINEYLAAVVRWD